MNGREKIVSFLASSLLLLGQMLPASATTVTLDTGIDEEYQSDPLVASFHTYTLSATNDSGSVITDFNGWFGILQLVAEPGAVGTASFVQDGMTNPVVNPSLGPSSTPPDAVTTTLDATYFLLAPMNGTTDAYQVGVGNETAAGTTWSIGQKYNLGDLQVELSPGALGMWTVFAINDRFDTGGWLDSETFNVAAFSNLPTAPSSPANSYTSLTIGTITAVPEPSSFLLAGSAIAAAGWYAARKRRTLAVLEA